MPTYAEILELDFAHLTTVADELDGAAGEFADAKEDYAQHVASVSNTGEVWWGISAEAAAWRFSNTEGELGAAESEARALAGVIREGVSELRRLREALTALSEEARAAGFEISGGGDVRDALERSGIPELEDGRAEWQAQVNDLVAQANEADYNLRIALAEIVQGRDGRRAGVFNGSPLAGEDQALAARAGALAERLAEGEELTAAEWEQLNRLLSGNADDGEFTRALLENLGADGLIDLSARIAEHAGEAGDSALGRRFHALNNGLAAALATATRVPAEEYPQWAQSPAGRFYADFMADLHEAGVAGYAVDGLTEREDVRGYQLLVGMMGTADDGVAGDFSERFLHDLADDVRAAEDPEQGGDPDLWHLGADDLNVDGIDEADLAAFALDPMDGLLGIMSHQPDVAASYLDPAHGNDRLDYLLNHRDWAQLGLPSGASVTYVQGDLDGLGAALQSATTGVPPDVGPGTRGIDITDAGARIMHDVVETLSANNAAPLSDTGPFQSLRPELARMTGAYMGDFQLAVSGLELPTGMEGIVDLNGLPVTEFLGQLGRDQEAHAIITGAQQAYTAFALDRQFDQPLGEGMSWADRVENAVASGAQMAGIMSQARADAVYDAGISGDVEYNERLDLVEDWAGMVLDECVGAVSERAGVAGPVIEWGVAELSESIFSTLERDNSEDAAQNAGDSYETGHRAAIDAAKRAVTVAASGTFDEDSQDMTDLRNAATRTVTSHFGLRISWSPPGADA
ncbi:DUF6571 family protein [Streptomyces hoynatensis]|uniref:DUF6571 domain-containing protein n=1 Tax=Streptomyces hoynatensis TaxID=1141874 RepID=A0A3A9ZER6_9ACTN|nr:DUF6571 family protein [Streptomyces hoynatensis]RKN45756.1 hypothetical protein D7294_04665 [Streptomyces hoynatensis]